jgi:menaquinone-dependent protoporphyrinogen oxidase
MPSASGRKSGIPPGIPLAVSPNMKTKIAIIFATREGQTRHVAERIAVDLRAAGAEVDVIELHAPHATRPIDWYLYTSACVASPVHLGKHERTVVDFVKLHRVHLEGLSTAFISVSLSEAGVEDMRRSEADRRQSAADVRRMIGDFVKETGWRPARVLPVAGALAYTRYNVLVRFVMKLIARKAGGPTDTTQDHELTDWTAVDRFARELA